MTRGIDLIAPGSRVRVTGDILAGDPADSDLIGLEGLVGHEDSGADVTVTFEDGRQYRFDPSELQVLTPAVDCPHGYKPTDSCPCCDIGPASDVPDNPQCPTDLGAERCRFDAGHDGACETAQDVQQRTVDADGCGR